MAKNKMVSIVVPIYNQENYLNTSIPSLINQKYENIEIILVNDGSTDKSSEIILKYAAVDSRIKIVNKENGGLVDATLAGIKSAEGKYIAFLDPDDRIGNDFISNFMEYMEDGIDCIAAGFYREKNGRLDPYFLYEDSVYEGNAVEELRNSYLYNKNFDGIPNVLFVSRWNKLYDAQCVKKTAEKFAMYKGISLGEDTIFTYLMLGNCKKVKTIKAPNSYFYNLSNQNSMMKNTAVENHLNRSRVAFEAFFKLLKADNNNILQAYALYYHLINSIFNRALQSDYSTFKVLYKTLRKDDIYKKSVVVLFESAKGLRSKYLLCAKRICIFPNMYLFMTSGMLRCAKGLKRFINSTKVLLKNISKKGIAEAFRAHKFYNSRLRAFEEIQKELPLLEERIMPILESYLNKKTILEDAPVSDKVFVFWWDGFENAPYIVQQCLKSVIKYHKGMDVVKISKNNYKNYTDINPVILADFEKGKISVQTFSDILRFNLLKNNGGTWIDATIFFTKEYILADYLSDKPFETVEFASSRYFLAYKNNVCSWSGYFIASRKNSVFVSAVDSVFEQYYLKYRTYSIYFFIDAVMMISKLCKLDGGVLDTVHYNHGDMFVLMKMLNKDFDPMISDTIGMIPQKLQWQYKNNASDKSVAKKLFLENEVV